MRSCDFVMNDFKCHIKFIVTEILSIGHPGSKECRALLEQYTGRQVGIELGYSEFLKNTPPYVATEEYDAIYSLAVTKAHGSQPKSLIVHVSSLHILYALLEMFPQEVSDVLGISSDNCDEIKSAIQK